MRFPVRGLVVLALFASCEVAPVPPATHGLLGGALYSSTDNAEATARAFLGSRASEFALESPGSTLTLSTTREGLSGTYLRFAQQQQVGATTLPVFEAEVIVLVHDDGKQREVRAVNLEHHPEAATVVERNDVGSSAAITRALTLVEAVAPFEGEPEATRGVFVTPAGTALIAWRVKVATETPPHAWTVYLDAATGEELARRDGVRFINGTAYVYDMNPVASTGDTTLVDGNNATTTALDAARYLVVLPRLDGTGNTSGTFANVRPRTAARINSPTNDFLFSRDSLGFEQANVYFHLDRVQAHIQALGFTNVNNRVQEAIVDAQNADNSFYSSNNQRLNFGLGGVDDAEDADIVCHEYGHSIQDNQVPGWGGGDENSMGEGFGDYLAASFAVTLAAGAGHAQLSDPACVGDWDGVSYSTTTPKCLRRVDEAKHFPEAEENEVHADGEMWSSLLWDLRGRLGGNLVDRLVLESHFILGPSSTFFTAGQALITADQNVNGGVNGVLLRRRLIAHGLSRTISAPAPPGAFTRMLVAVGPNRNAAGNYASSTDETKTLSVPGATGLVVHFSRIDLETNNQCFQNGCDNIYLTNADGDLFQVFSGVQANVSSAAVVGDTVNIRLVSDSSQVRFGYHVDWLEVLGASIDGGVIFDGGMDVIDAGTPPIDAGVRDAGVPDAGSADAGDPIIDAGPPPVPDAGVRDAGVPVRDGGTVMFSKTLTAYGNERLSPALNRGCGCGATSGLEAWAALALLGLINRRRRR